MLSVIPNNLYTYHEILEAIVDGSSDGSLDALLVDTSIEECPLVAIQAKYRGSYDHTNAKGEIDEMRQSINGCFWHGHEGCRYFRLPSSNVEFWEAKIKRNRERDAKDIADLQNKGWRVITVWECQVKRKSEREASLEAIYNSVISGQ